MIMNTPVTPTMAVLVQSCDKYQDLWRPFYHFFFKHWPDIPFPIYHLSEQIRLGDARITDISSGPGKTWSEMLIGALKSIDEKYVLLLLEDYFLVRDVNNERLHALLALANANAPAFIRIFPVPGPDFDHPKYAGIGIIRKNSAYSISTQATIWDRKKLLNFLKPEESAWDLEISGSKRAHEIEEPFWSVKDRHGKRKAEEFDYPYTYLCTAVYKGKWMREAVELCRHEGVTLDLQSRKVESRFERFHRKNYYKMPKPFQHLMDYIKMRLQ
jgi:hypothetical protein